MRRKWSLAYFQHTVLTHNLSEKNGTNVKYLTHDSNISGMDSDVQTPKFTSHYLNELSVGRLLVGTTHELKFYIIQSDL